MYLINIARALVYSHSVFFLGRIVEGVWNWNWVKNANAIKQMHIQYLFCQTVSDSFLCFAFFLLCFGFVYALFFRRLFLYEFCLYLYILSNTPNQANKWRNRWCMIKREKERERAYERKNDFVYTYHTRISCGMFFLCRPICTCMTQKRPKIKISGIYCASWKCYLFANGNANTQTHRDTFIHFRMYMCVALTLKFLSNSKVLITVYLLLLMML